MASQLSRNKFLIIAVQQISEVPRIARPIFLDFNNLLPNILYRMVGVYYSWECIVNMSDRIKTGIISVASKNGDYIKKHLKILHQKI